MTSVVAPMCMACARLRRNDPGFTCDAFPGRIPTAIIESRADHRKPYPGDNQLLFQMDPEWALLPDKPGLLGQIPT